MPYQYFTADVFTEQPFGGNQLAVVPDARGLTDADMLAIAREFNYSETIFVFPPDDPIHTRRVRIMTPERELPFAGHPTVGCALVLAQTGNIPLTDDETDIVLEEGVGPVKVKIRSREGRAYFAQLTTAKIPEKFEARYDKADLAKVLSLDPGDIDSSGIEAWSVGLPFVYVPLVSRDALERARIKLDAWEKSVKGTVAQEIYLFTRDGDDYRARMFGPMFGIAEDPATGSACAAFGGYIAARSSIRDGTLKHIVHQGVEMGRPSRMELEVDIAGGAVAAVRVGGGAVLVSSGTLLVPL